MELPLDSNSEIVFTLKLSKTFMKTVENSDHQDAGELIILTKDANQCVGSIAIGNPIQCTCQKDSARITEPVNQVKIPRKRGRKRKCDIAIKNNCEEIANQSISAQVTDEGYQGEPLDLSVKKSDQGRNFEFVGKQKINEMAMDLSVRKKKTFGSFTSASKQPNNCIRSQESTTTQREAVITSTINGAESDFSSEIFQLISSLPNVDSVPSNLEPKPNTAPVPKQRKNSKKLVEPKQPKKAAVPKIYFCDFCSFSTPSKHIMKRHEIGEHENARPFACTICDHRCKQKTNLKIHYMHKHKMLGSEAADLIIKQGMEKSKTQEQDSPLSAASSPGEKDHSEHEEKVDLGSATESDSNLKFLPSPHEKLEDDQDQKKNERQEMLGFSGLGDDINIPL